MPTPASVLESPVRDLLPELETFTPTPMRTLQNTDGTDDDPQRSSPVASARAGLVRTSGSADTFMMTGAFQIETTRSAPENADVHPRLRK